jgi:hypothetical protein
MRRDPAIVDLNHLVQTPHSATLLLLVHLASIPGVSTPPLVLSARVPQFKCAKESVRYPFAALAASRLWNRTHN